jgi:uncharacterized membrane protein YidH (DUF202 family)
MAGTNRPGRDTGLASERTALSWQRTGLSLVVAGIAIVKGIPTRAGVPGRAFLGEIVLVLGSALLLISGGAAHRRAQHAAARPAAELPDLAPMALATALVAAAAFVTVVVRGI